MGILRFRPFLHVDKTSRGIDVSEIETCLCHSNCLCILFVQETYLCQSTAPKIETFQGEVKGGLNGGPRGTQRNPGETQKNPGGAGAGKFPPKLAGPRWRAESVEQNPTHTCVFAKFSAPPTTSLEQNPRGGWQLWGVKLASPKPHGPPWSLMDHPWAFWGPTGIPYVAVLCFLMMLYVVLCCCIFSNAPSTQMLYMGHWPGLHGHLWWEGGRDGGRRRRREEGGRMKGDGGRGVDIYASMGGVGGSRGE